MLSLQGHYSRSTELSVLIGCCHHQSVWRMVKSCGFDIIRKLLHIWWSACRPTHAVSRQ